MHNTVKCAVMQQVATWRWTNPNADRSFLTPPIRSSQLPLAGLPEAGLVRRNFLEAEGLQPMWAASHWIDSCWLVAPLRGQRSYPPGYGAN